MDVGAGQLPSAKTYFLHFLQECQIIVFVTVKLQYLMQSYVPICICWHSRYTDGYNQRKDLEGQNTENAVAAF